MMKNFREIFFHFRLQLLTLIIFSAAASAQSSKELKEIFAQAEAYYLYEDYELANQLYILLDNPDNLNVKYKIGACYLNIPDEKEKAILMRRLLKLRIGRSILIRRAKDDS